MQKLRIAIADDEPLALEILQTYLGKMQQVICVGSCKNALELYALLNRMPVDLVLLDINMPEMSGIEFLRTLKNPPKVIFTTAYAAYAVESYELNAVDYLLKPISFPRFSAAIQKAMALNNSDNKETNAPSPTEHMLFVRTDGKWLKINLTELWLIEGLKDYLRLWIGSERITIHSTMKNFEEQLKLHQQFIRVHKSYMVNMDFVAEVVGNSLLINGQQIAIGASFKEELGRVLNQYKLC